jgi:pyrroline-5-carboxylate reductase
MIHVLLVGAGNMGFAMLQTWVGMDGYQFSVIEMNQSLRDRADVTGARSYAAVSDLPEDYKANVLVIATKPQAVASAVTACRDALASGGMVISVAAGVTIDALRQSANDYPAIIRCMPNTPAAICEGMIVCCPSANSSQSDRDLAYKLLSAIGRVAFIDDEGLMDAVTAVSGSGPAYVFLLLEAFAAAGISAGLPPELAMLLAKQTVFGAAKLALAQDANPTLLREQVTSPNGTTAAALAVLMRPSEGLASLMEQAVEAARQRSNELGS